MRGLLHIIATPRREDSRTLKVSQVFLDNFKKKNPNCRIDESNLYSENLPALTVPMISGKYVLLSGKELSKDLKNAWKPIERHIQRFLAADAYLISTPMWNFSIPYPLKQYIDILVQPRYLFRYTETGVEGLVKNRRMVVVASRGGDYSETSPFHSYDYQESYLRAIFGFVGITDITFIIAQPMNMGPELEAKGLEKAKAEAIRVANSF